MPVVHMLTLTFFGPTPKVYYETPVFEIKPNG